MNVNRISGEFLYEMRRKLEELFTIEVCSLNQQIYSLQRSVSTKDKRVQTKSFSSLLHSIMRLPSISYGSSLKSQKIMILHLPGFQDKQPHINNCLTPIIPSKLEKKVFSILNASPIINCLTYRYLPIGEAFNIEKLCTIKYGTYYDGSCF